MYKKLVFLLVIVLVTCMSSSLMAEEPLNILFMGNSFTIQGPIPDLVQALATDAGWATPYVERSARNGKDLAFHCSFRPGLNLIDQGIWDYVVLQGYSTEATDNLGDPPTFKANATILYDRVKAANPTAQVILYETWARRSDHHFYPNDFADRDEMQAQINFHYHDCAENYIPTNSTAMIKTDVTVAPVGEVWHANYHDLDINLHDDEGYHANNNGRYVNSMAIYSTIYQSPVSGLNPLLDVTPAHAAYLQAICDTVTGQSGAVCSDDTCDPGEDQCNCPEDCGTPPATETVCDDGVDEDCDNYTDCDDSDCLGDPACPTCGDETCDPGEDQCNCPDDCGTPPSTETSCTDGVDNDCDTYTDCDDSDCDGDPACPDCLPKGAACTDNAECCSGNCLPAGRCK